MGFRGAQAPEIFCICRPFWAFGQLNLGQILFSRLRRERELHGAIFAVAHVQNNRCSLCQSERSFLERLINCATSAGRVFSRSLVSGLSTRDQIRTVTFHHPFGGTTNMQTCPIFFRKLV